MSLSIKYEPLINVGVTSTASLSSYIDCFEFCATTASKNLMKDYGLVASFTDKGFTIHYKLNKLVSPDAAQLVGEINSEVQLLFLLRTSNTSKLKVFKNSFPDTTRNSFFITNKTDSGIKPNNAGLTINTALRNEDKTALKLIQKNENKKIYTLKRSGDAASFELNLQGQFSTPLAVLEIILNDSQRTTNNLNYKIQIN